MLTVTPEISSQNLNEMQDFLGSLARGLPTVSTTKTPAGHVLDWIPRDSQLAGAPIASPPPDLQPAIDTDSKVNPATPELLLPGVPNGPEGTVPVRRPVAEAMSNFQSLFQREHIKVPPPNGLLAKEGFPKTISPRQSPPLEHPPLPPRSLLPLHQIIQDTTTVTQAKLLPTTAEGEP
jgi:hypothetical protein